MVLGSRFNSGQLSWAAGRVGGVYLPRLDQRPVALLQRGRAVSNAKTLSRADAVRQAWEDAERFRSPLSPLMQGVKAAMLSIATSDEDAWWQEPRSIADRIGRHTGEWIEAPVFIGRYEGQRVGNSDIEAWASVNMRGNRLVSGWHTISSEITDALHGMRRWQAYERFAAKGVTSEHRKLAARLGWEFSMWRGDGVSIYVQGKRPFGNSDIEGDIADAVGWPQPWREDGDWDGDRPDDFNERAWDLFEELQFAVPTILMESTASPAAAPPSTPAPR